MFYLLAYGFTVIAAFAVVTLVRDADGEATHLSRWAGPGPPVALVAGVFTFLLLAFAGIPLTSGFTGKFVVFRAGVTVAAPLVVIALIASAVAAFFYLRIVVLMYFSEPAADGPTIALPSPLTMTALWVGVAATVILGIVPQPILDLADKASLFAGG